MSAASSFVRRSLNLSLVLFCSFYLSACEETSGSENSAENGFNEVKEVSTIGVDGVFLMEDHDKLYLIDPNSGNVSERAWTKPSSRYRGYDVSPDGQFVAIVDREQTTTTTLYKFVWNGDIPHLDPVHSWDTTGRNVAFNGSGDRLYTNFQWINLDDQSIFSCYPDGNQPHNVDDDNPYHILRILPDNYHFLCPPIDRDHRLFHDTQPRYLPDGGQSMQPSFDGQWLGPQMHLPTYTYISHLGINGQNTGGDYNWVWRVQRNTTEPIDHEGNGWNGISWAQVSAGWSMIWEQSSSNALPAPITHYRSFGQTFNELDLSPLSTNDSVTNLLLPYLSDGELRRWTVVGFVDTTDEVVYDIQYANWVTVQSESGTSYSADYIGRKIIAISPEGNVRVLDTGYDINPDENGGYGEISLHNYGTKGLAIVGNYNQLYAGFDDNGNTFIEKESGRLSTDKQWFIQNHFTPDDARTLCLRSTRLNAATQCMPHPSQGEIAAIIAQGQHPNYQDKAPLIRSVARPTNFDGQETVIFGAHFGDSGKIFVGDTELDQSVIEQWTDTQIRIRVTAEQPASGQLVIQTDAGTSSKDLAYWLFRTPVDSTPFDGLTNGPIELKQGLNIVDLGDIDIEAVHGGQVNIVIDIENRAPDNHYYIHSVGTLKEYESTAQLGISSFRRHLPVVFKPTLANTASWQPAYLTTHATPTPPHSFAYMGPYLINQRMNELIITNENGVIKPTKFAAEYVDWVPSQDGIFAKVHNIYDYKLITGFEPDGTAIVDDARSIDTNHYLQHLAVADDIFLLTGRVNDNANRTGLYKISFDSGQTWEEPVDVVQTYGQHVELLIEPQAVIRQGEPYFIVRELSNPTAFHGIDKDGNFEHNILPADNLSGYKLVGTSHNFILASIVIGAGKRQIIVADINSNTPQWQPLVDDTVINDETVKNYTFNALQHTLDILLTDNRVIEIQFTTDNFDVQESTLQPELLLSADIDISAATRMETGQWILTTAITDPQSGDEPFYGKGNYLLNQMP